jgi:hypothetical protein
MTLRRTMARALAGGVLLTGITLVTAAAPSQAASSYPYTFHEQEHENFTDTGICSDGPADITLDNGSALHVNATQSGLTEDQVDALLEDDPTGILTSVTYTEHGTATIIESAGEQITGQYTNWFGGNVTHDGHTQEFGGTFSFEGTDQFGNHISGHFPSHVTFVNGEPVIDIERGSVRGCPA